MVLVGNGYLITRSNQGVIENGCVVIDHDLIKEVGSTGELRKKYPEEKFIDAKNKVIMPGLINTHMHLYSTFARGMALKDAAPENFLEILERLWWRLDKKLTLEDIYYSALVAMIDCVKNGTTTIFDHHASPYAIKGSLSMMAEAADLIGLRSCFCYEVSDRDGENIACQGIKENIEFIKECQQNKNDLINGMFGLHASFTLSGKTLEMCCRANEGTGAGFHIHAAEDRADVEDSLRKTGKGVIERLNDYGMLGPKTITAHCVHVTKQEIGLLQETNTNVVHNPESNMGNAVGCAPVLEMVQQGVRVGLGTDGYTSDMFESYKVANILHKFNAKNPSVAWGEIPEMLFEQNAVIAGKYFPGILGRLIPGAKADIIVVDYDPPTPLDENNMNGHILFGMSGRAVETTIINGRSVIEERKLKDIDEAEIMVKSRELARKLWKRF